MKCLTKWLLLRNFRHQELTRGRKIDRKLTRKEKWLQLFSHLKEQEVSGHNLGLTMVHHGQTARVENVFSLLNNSWDSQMTKDIWSCVNFGLSYNEFLKKKSILKKVHPSNKYNYFYQNLSKKCNNNLQICNSKQLKWD